MSVDKAGSDKISQSYYKKSEVVEAVQFFSRNASSTYAWARNLLSKDKEVNSNRIQMYQTEEDRGGKFYLEIMLACRIVVRVQERDWLVFAKNKIDCYTDKEFRACFSEKRPSVLLNKDVWMVFTLDGSPVGDVIFFTEEQAKSLQESWLQVEEKQTVIKKVAISWEG